MNKKLRVTQRKHRKKINRYKAKRKAMMAGAKNPVK